MPKRKNCDDVDSIERKIRRLEKKLRRKQRRHRSSRRRHRSVDSGSSSSSVSRKSRSVTPDVTNQQGSDEDDYYERFFDNEDILSDRDQSYTQPNGSSLNDSPAENNKTIPSTTVCVIPNPTDTSAGSAKESTADVIPLVEPATETLDSELLDILGSDPTTNKKYGKDIQKDLAVRVQHWTSTGLTKELRNELKDKYLTPENCKLIDPPELNAEIKAAISDITLKRDMAIESKQKKLSLTISALGEAISVLMSSKEKNTALIKVLMDSIRIACDCQYADTVTRRKFLMSAVKKEVREQLQKTKTDKLLFGENLAETLKTAKAINKSGTELKPSTSKAPYKKPIPSTSTATRNLNWRGQGPSRKPTTTGPPPRTREHAPTSTRTRPANFSKPSQHQQPPSRQNYNRR